MTTYKLTDVPATLYTPDGREWTLDEDYSRDFRYLTDNGLTHAVLSVLIRKHGEVSTTPYSRRFKVGDQLTTEQEVGLLPEGSVVLNRKGIPLHKVFNDEWGMPGEIDVYYNGELAFPVTVLYMPEPTN